MQELKDVGSRHDLLLTLFFFSYKVHIEQKVDG